MAVSPESTVAESRNFTAQELIHAAFLSGDNPILVVESKSRRILAANEAVTRVFGYACDELKDQSTEILHVDRDCFRRFGEMSEAVLAGGKRSYHCYYELKRRNGEVFDTENLVYLLHDEWGDQMVVVSVIRDLSEPDSIPLPSHEGLDFMALSDNLPGAVFQCALRQDGNYLYNFFRGDLVHKVGLNPSNAEQNFQAVLDLVAEDDRQRLLDGLERTADTLSVLDLEVSVHTRAGEQMWVRGISQPRRLDDGSTLWDGILIDITMQRQVEEQLHYLYTHDVLTGLANRKSFDDQLNSAIYEARSGNTNILVAILDMQQFHRINELHGFRFGDGLLISIGNRLRERLPALCVIARFYGDEFLVMFPALHGMDAINDAAMELINIFDQPFEVKGQRSVSVQAKIGMAMYPGDGDTAKALRRRADVALKRARKSVDLRYAYYSREMTDDLMQSAYLEDELRTDIDNRVPEPHYQPQYDLGSGRLDGFESLARWPSRNDGLVSPGKFIPVAEYTGLIIPLGRLLVEKVLADISAWERQGLTVPPVAINISAYQVRQPDFMGWLLDAINASGIQLDEITIEITESAFLLDFDQASMALKDLQANGLRLSLDDFGTGFSSLSYLHRLPFHELKIDKSFVNGMHEDSKKQSLVRGIIELGQALDQRVIAEGVENAEQLYLLQDMGCNAVQGFLLGRPAPAEDYTETIRTAGPHPVFRQET